MRVVPSKLLKCLKIRVEIFHEFGEGLGPIDPGPWCWKATHHLPASFFRNKLMQTVRSVSFKFEAHEKVPATS